MLLNILQCTEQPPITRNYLPPAINSAEGRTPSGSSEANGGYHLPSQSISHRLRAFYVVKVMLKIKGEEKKFH